MKQLINIIVSVCALISFTCHAQSGVETTDLSNMRAVMAVKTTPSGENCQVDVRGRSSLTPNFVKTASVSTDLIESDIPYCDADDTSELQAQTKQFYLENGYKQKTSAGALLGTALKSMGVGCVFGAGISWFFQPHNTKNKVVAQKINPEANCIDCADKKKNPKEVDQLAIEAGAIVGGATELFSKNIAGNAIDIELARGEPSSKSPKVTGSISKKSVPERSFLTGKYLGTYLTGVVSGIAGAIVCEGGTTYLLSDDKKTDI